jgi:hypothetical protein
MNIHIHIKEQLPVDVNALQIKIISYLKFNNYIVDITGQGSGKFTDNEFEDAKVTRIFNHDRLGNGNFQLTEADAGTWADITYIIPAWPILLIAAVPTALCIGLRTMGYLNIFVFYSLALGYRTYYLKKHVFKDILAF